MANISSHTKKILKDYIQETLRGYISTSDDFVDYMDYFNHGFTLKVKHEKQYKTETPLYKVSVGLKSKNNFIHFYLIELEDGDFQIFESFTDFFMDRSSNTKSLMKFIKRQCYLYHINFSDKLVKKEIIVINHKENTNIFSVKPRNKEV